MFEGHKIMTAQKISCSSFANLTCKINQRRQNQNLVMAANTQAYYSSVTNKQKHYVILDLHICRLFDTPDDIACLEGILYCL